MEGWNGGELYTYVACYDYVKSPMTIPQALLICAVALIEREKGSA